MSMQRVNINLKALSENFAERSERGDVCLILKDTIEPKLRVYTSYRRVKDSYSEDNKNLIKRCFADRKAKTIKVVTYDGTDKTVDDALNLLNLVKYNYLAFPVKSATDEEKKKVADFIKLQRDNTSNVLPVKAVLNNYSADTNGVINFINSSITVSDDTVYTGAEFTADIACMAAICGFKSSLTNEVVTGIKEVDSVGNSIEDYDDLVDAGKLFIYYDIDLEDFVLSRAVNSMTTVGENQKASLKKIRITDILDTIRDDIKVTFKKHYQGKVDNSYNNRKLFRDAINTYLETLEKQGALTTKTVTDEDGNEVVLHSRVWLSVDKTRDYLESKGVEDVDSMSDEAILSADLDEKIFLDSAVYVVDAMEDLDLDLGY